MSWIKQKDDLLTLLEEINKIDLNSDQNSIIESYLIKWLKVRKICKALINRDDIASEEKKVPLSLLNKFKQNVQPKLQNFIKSIKKFSIKENLIHFNSVRKKYLDEAEDHLKILPMVSFSIYEEAQFFINLYQFIFAKSLIGLAKNDIINRMKILKKAFEVESGAKDLKESISQLDIIGKSTTVNSSDPVISEEDVLVSDVLLPEENSAVSIQDQIVIEPHSKKIPIILEKKEVIQDKPRQIQKTYSYSKWFPENNWQDFAYFRYCQNCGFIINKNNQLCSRCNYAIIR